MFKSVEINNREELYKWLSGVDTSHKKETSLSSVYYLVEFNKHIEPMYFMHYNGAYFESPCMLREYNMNSIELEDYIKGLYEAEHFDEALEYEKTLQRGDKHYEIDNPQCSPFLPKEIKILDILSESECLDWLLKNS